MDNKEQKDAPFDFSQVSALEVRAMQKAELVKKAQADIVEAQGQIKQLESGIEQLVATANFHQGAANENREIAALILQTNGLTFEDYEKFKNQDVGADDVTTSNAVN